MSLVLRHKRPSRTSRRLYCARLLVSLFLLFAPLANYAHATGSSLGEPFVYNRWETYYVEQGLPNNHIFALRADGDKLWIGTEGGLACYQNGRFRRWTEADGLPWRVVSGIAVSPKTGDVWLALFGGGIARFSGGRFDNFNQFNSGLVNDVVYGIAVEGDTVWAATTAGLSAYDTLSDRWEIYTEKNAPMEEIWCYNVDAADGKVYVAVWGGGVLEWDTRQRRWNAHHDPDREMEIDLYRDDGLIHIITTAVSYTDKVLWAATYFGLSRYDGRHWRGYMDHDSGLPSNFINHVKARSADAAYLATDRGLGVLADYTTDTWVRYQRPNDHASHWTAQVGTGKEIRRTQPIDLDLPNHFIICLEFQGDDLWIGTGHGLARGVGHNFYPGLHASSNVELPALGAKAKPIAGLASKEQKTP
jgi:ligand-binding sensor domain-containing protein